MDTLDKNPPSAALLQVAAKAIPQEPFEPILAAEVLDHPVLGGGVQLLALCGEGWVGDGGEEGDVRVLGARLAGKQGLEYTAVPAEFKDEI